MDISTTASLTRLAATQHGVVSRAQVLDLGASSSQVRRARERGLLVAVGRRTFGVGSPPSTFEGRAMAACLELDGVASHRTAARLHGLHGFSRAPIEVVIDRRAHHEQHPLARVHTTTNLPLDDRVMVAGIPTVGVARTFMMLAALVPEVRREVIVDALDVALRDGLVTETWLRWRLEQLRCRGRDGVQVTQDLLDEREAGSPESWLERRVLELIAEAGLPAPIVQQRIELPGGAVRVDACYPPVRLVLEVEGHGYHSTAKERAADEARRNRLRLQGWNVLVFVHRQVVLDPESVPATVAAALTLARPA